MPLESEPDQGETLHNNEDLTDVAASAEKLAEERLCNITLAERDYTDPIVELAKAAGPASGQ